MTYEDRLILKRYLVTGKRKYRWHNPGTTFEARLDPLAEQRALERGSIRILEQIVQRDIEIGSYHLPQDWPPNVADERIIRGASVSRVMS